MTTITALYKGEAGLEAVIGRHRVVVDVPVSSGGKDRGPTPQELFVASLGSCVAAFVASYCDRAGLDARDLSVDVSFEQAHEEPTSLEDLEVVIKLPHAECGERVEAIRRVAEHCPVHETVEYNLKAIDFEIYDRTKLAANAS